MYNSQYYTCEQIDQRLLQGYLDDYNTQTGQSLTKAQFLTKLGNIFSKEDVIDNIATQIGYYECDTAAGTAAKAITVANYALFAGGSMKVKFANKNTANNATLNINSQGAKALYYQGERASSTNSWDEGEVVEIYYDGTNYYANNVKGGSGSGVYDVSKEHPTSGPNSDGKFTLEYILNSSNVNELIPVNKRYPGMSIQFVSTYDNKYVQYRLTSDTFNTTVANWQGVDDEPIPGSKNLVESGGVAANEYYIGNIHRGSIDTNGNWINLTTGLVRLYSIFALNGFDGKNVEVKAASTKEAYVHFLSEYNPVEGGDAGVLGSMVVAANTTSTSTVPSGTKYVYTLVQASGNVDAKPVVFDIAGIDILSLAKDNVLKLKLKIDEIHSSLLEDLSELEEKCGHYEDDDEYVYVILDTNKKILFGIKNDGSVDIPSLDLSEIQAAISEIQAAISEIQLEIDDLYYRKATDNIISQNPADELIPKIDNLLRGYRTSTASTTPDNKVLCLLHFSDVHNYSANMVEINRFAEQHTDKIDDVIHTGDLVGNNIPTTISPDFKDTWLNCVGNHDAVNSLGEILPAIDSYNAVFAPYISNWGLAVDGHPTNATYYYKDYLTEKVRLIVLDNYVDGESANNHWNATQKSWFEGVLAETLNSNKDCYGYHVVVAVHYPPFIITKNLQNPWQGYDKTISSNQTCVSEIPTCVKTFITNGGKFACWLCGHTHYDFVGINENYPKQIAITVGASMTPNVAVRWDDGARVEGTKTQYLFNLVGIDAGRNTLKVLRIGSDMDRYMRKKESFCYDYSEEQFIQIN